MAQKWAALFNSDHALKSQAHTTSSIDQLKLGHIHWAATQLINKLKVISEGQDVEQFNRAKTAAWIFRRGLDTGQPFTTASKRSHTTII